jgi:hypothetical protein
LEVPLTVEGLGKPWGKWGKLWKTMGKMLSGCELLLVFGRFWAILSVEFVGFAMDSMVFGKFDRVKIRIFGC